MKKLAVIVLLLLIIFMSPVRLSAEEYPVPSQAESLAEEKLTPENASSLLSPSKIAGYIFRAFASAFGSKTAFIAEMFALLFAVYLVSALGGSLGSDGLVSAMSFAVVAVSGLTLFSAVFSAVNTLIDAYSQLSGFLSALLPVFLASLASSGHSAAAASGGTALFLAIEVITVIMGNGLMPFANMYLVIGAAAGISDNINLKTISTFIRNTAIALMTLALTLFCGIMTLQSTLAMTGDTVAKRAAKLAAGTFIPVFGGAIGEGLETAFASATIIKNTSGIFGTAVVFLTLLPSVAEIAADLVVVSVSCALCSFFGNSRASAFFTTVRDCLVILLAAACACAIVLLAGLSVLIKI